MTAPRSLLARRRRLLLAAAGPVAVLVAVLALGAAHPARAAGATTSWHPAGSAMSAPSRGRADAAPVEAVLTADRSAGTGTTGPGSASTGSATTGSASTGSGSGSGSAGIQVGPASTAAARHRRRACSTSPATSRPRSTTGSEASSPTP